MSLKKPKCLTLHEKSFIIQELDNGGSVTNLSKKYGVAKSTICNIKSKRQTILSAVANTYVGPGKRRTLKSSELPKMEQELYDWFLNLRNQNVTVSGEMLKQKAKMLHSEMKETEKEFTASDGWLQRFKRRFGIQLSKISGAALLQPELLGLSTTIDEDPSLLLPTEAKWSMPNTDESSKRKRTSNFQNEDELILLEEVQKFEHIIENKNALYISAREKTEAWKKVLDLFNARSSETRSLEQIKCKYDNLKVKARKINNNNTERHSESTKSSPLFDSALDIIGSDIDNCSDYEEDSSSVDIKVERNDDEEVEQQNVNNQSSRVIEAEQDFGEIPKQSNFSSSGAKFLKHHNNKKHRKLEEALLQIQETYYQKKIQRTELEIECLLNRTAQENAKAQSEKSWNLQKRAMEEEEHTRKMQLLDLQIKKAERDLCENK